MAKVSIAKRQYDFEKGTVTFLFAHGATVTVSPQDFPENIQKNLAVNGVSQKLGDMFADAEGNPEAAHASFMAGLESLKQGKWSQRAAGEGGSKHTMLVEALSLATGQTMEASAKVVENLDKEQRKALRQHEQIAKALVEIEHKRLQEKAAKLAANPATGGTDLKSLFAQG